MTTQLATRPLVVTCYDDNGARRLMSLGDREVARAEGFMRRVLRAEAPMRGRYALITSTFLDLANMVPFERVISSMGVVCCNAEANPYDGARIESIIRRFDVAVVAVVSEIVLKAIQSAGYDPLTLLKGKIVWASGAAYRFLREADGLNIRRWEELGPALAFEGRDGDGAHVDGREWLVESEGDTTFISSRLDRAHSFNRLRINKPVELLEGSCSTGAFGPRILL